MSFRPASPSQEYVVLKEDRDDNAIPTQPVSDPAYLESSEDDEPRITCRRVRNEVRKQMRIPAPGAHRSSRAHTNRQSYDSMDSDSDSPVPRQPTEAYLKRGSKHKTSSSGMTTSKPVMKKDLRAKKAVIREIESLWGRGFIKSYIPKCHRPLTKRVNGKRSYLRDHETDPINWMPSVLKAILMIAKLTDDKQWLKKAMNDIVRYRIKHTGNRKPQLVTTDFSVIEDMLVKDWSVPFAFDIRYKHILFQSKDEEVSGEVIDRIMDAGSDDDDDHVNQDDEDGQEETEEEEGTVGKPVPTKHHQSSSSTKVRQYSSPARSRRRSTQSKTSDQIVKQTGSSPQATSSGQPPGTYGNGPAVPGYGQLLDPWGRPMPAYWGPHGYNNGHGGFGGHGGHGSYGPYTGFRGTHPGMQPPTHGLPYYPLHPHAMAPTSSVPGSDYSRHGIKHKKRERESSSAASKHARHTHTFSPSHNMQAHPDAGTAHGTTIKRESTTDDDMTFDDDWAIPKKELEDEEEEKEVDEDDVIDAEVEVMELELKLAELKAKRFRQRCKKR